MADQQVGGNIDTLIELNDSDILRLESVQRILNDRLGARLNLEAFRKEILERFAEVGFKVDVKAWTTQTPGIYAFDIEIQERLAGQFDPDQMVHEAVNDILNLGDGGVIKTDSGLLVSGDYKHQHKH